MPDLHVYLPEPLRSDAEKGQVNILNRIGNAVGPAGYRLRFHAEGSRAQGGLHMVHMKAPFAPGCLCLRRAYTYPFWQIEATHERQDFDVARAGFDPDSIDMAEARPFFRRWRDKFLGPGEVTRDGFVFLPLQGRLREHRSFQSMSPLAMIEAALEADPARRMVATLHPRESYDAADHAALAAISARFPRFELVRADAATLVRGCDYIVTQNSAVALTGYFAKKPAVVFAGIDFHHIAGSVPRDGVEAAFAMARAARGFVPYLYWFFRLNTINGGAAEAETQILTRLRRHGWPV